MQLQSTDTCYSTDEPWKLSAKWKKSDTKDHILANFIYTKCPKQAEKTDNVDYWLPGAGDKEEWGMTPNEYMASFWFNENVSNWIVAVVANLVNILKPLICTLKKKQI